MSLETALAEVYHGDFKNIQQFVEHLQRDKGQPIDNR
jgi:hypothetical protein